MSVHMGEDKKGFIPYRVKFVEPALTSRESASLRIWPSVWGKILQDHSKRKRQEPLCSSNKCGWVFGFFAITKILLLGRNAPKISKLDPNSSNFCWNHQFYLYRFTHPYRKPFQCSYYKLNTCLGTTKIRVLWIGMERLSYAKHQLMVDPAKQSL